jgi:hypothetical protein
MTRTGKIARLPRENRDQLNRRLHNGEPGNKLATWLNSLPEVNAILRKEFNGQPVSPQNLSEWKAGGYRDWLLQQQTIDLVRLMQADSDELSQASKTRLTDLLAQRLAAQLVIVAQSLNQSTGDGVPDANLLRQLCADIVALRKGDHSAERLKIDREQLDIERDRLDLDRERVAIEGGGLKMRLWTCSWSRSERIPAWPTPPRGSARPSLSTRIQGWNRTFPPVSAANCIQYSKSPKPPAALIRPNQTKSNQIKPDQTKSNH